MNTGHSPDGQIALARSLGVFDATMIGVGAMIGAGIFILTGHAAAVAGPAFLVAFLLNGLVTLFTATSYAELGSCLPSAGGSYRWVKEALTPFFGYCSGWLDWFAHTAACGLYSQGFGAYAADLLSRASLTPPGLEERSLALLFSVIIALLFTLVNYLGASETGAVGNIVTMTKVVILGLFAALGLISLFRLPGWTGHFTPLFPRGLPTVLVAMGLTTIAFQGYEVIAQCGEELKHPRRNLPRAVFTAILIVVLIYLLVGFVALAAIDVHRLPPDAAATLPPTVKTTWQFLAHYQETAMVQAARQVMPYGEFLLLFAGLVSTMSALNATIYSSSRVSFAMGRDRNLPFFFGQVHPQRRTPHWAILTSGLLVVWMVTLLPIRDVASAADIMFLIVFALVNISAIRLRKLRPELDRGFRIPLMPIPPLLGIGFQLILALFLFELSPTAWYTTLIWVGLGLLFYYAYASRAEALPEPKVAILHEEIVAFKKYSVLFSLDHKTRIEQLTPLVAALARAHDGEILALHVVRVPVQLSISQGRLFLKEDKPLLERVIASTQSLNVPVHSLIRLSRDVVGGINASVKDRDANLLFLDWRGYTRSQGYLFGSVIDLLVANPPCDLAVVNLKGVEEIRHILVPTAGGPHASLAIQLAADLARQVGATVKVVNICAPADGPEGYATGQQLIREAAQGVPDFPFEQEVILADDVVAGILAQAEDHNLVILGATQEPLFRRLLVGDIPEKVVRLCPKTVIMVKRYEPIRSRLRRLADFFRSLLHFSALNRKLAVQEVTCDETHQDNCWRGLGHGGVE